MKQSPVAGRVFFLIQNITAAIMTARITRTPALPLPIMTVKFPSCCTSSVDISIVVLNSAGSSKRERCEEK